MSDHGLRALRSPRLQPHPARVVVTGIGLITGLGDRARTWTALKEGRHAFRVLDVPVAEGAPPHAGSPVAGDDDGDRPATATALLAQAVLDACADAALLLPLDDRAHDPDRAGVVIGLSKGDLGHLATLHEPLARAAPGAGGCAALASWPEAWPDAVARWAAARGGFHGPCLAPVAACATGLVAALQGAALIRRGRCDLVLAGAGDSSLDPLVLGAYRRMGILARVPGDPGRAVRPWDKARSGFLVGAGAAVLVLEHAEHARRRGIVPYAELAGGALGADAYHMTDLDPDPTGLAEVINRALAHAGVPAGTIDHVNVHGTATRGNDPLECRALRTALGSQADRVACSANKSQIGHLLGAAGAAELAITCLAVHHGFVPPTLNLTDPDPACDLDGTPHTGRPREIEVALKLSIGFGGHLAAAVVKRCDQRRVLQGV
jgi:3-oxoacyl-[acyl-carrier-protein] synthase II